MPRPDDPEVDPRPLAELLLLGKTTAWNDDADRPLDERGEEPAPAAAASGRLGEYQLLEKLGEGGMGVVYQARHTELDRLVAVKVLATGRLGDAEAVARFRREIRAAGRLDHANIVRAHDARQIGGAHLLVMEYVDGVDLGTLVRQRGPLRIADACELVRQADVERYALLQPSAVLPVLTHCGVQVV
jgi:serine/threonine protein kinase